MNNERISRYLQHLAQKHPELASLIDRIPEDLETDQAFWDRYFRSSVSPVKKAFVLRALLCDNRIVPDVVFDPAALKRMMQYFLFHPKHPANDALRLGNKEIIPKAVTYLLGNTQTNPPDYYSEIGIKPYLAYLNGLPSPLYERAGLPPGTDLSVLKPLLTSRLLTAVQAETLVNSEENSNNFGRIFFDTGVPELDVRNAVIYMQALANSDRQGGRIQNRIPIRLSRLFNISRLSVPEVLVSLDVISLWHNGVIDINKVRKDHDFLGLRKVSRLLEPDFHGLELDAVNLTLSQHNLLDAASAEEILALKMTNTGMKRKKVQRYQSGRYDSSMVFNVDRLIHHKKHKATFAKFQHYYQAIDTDLLNAHVLTYYQEQSPDFGDWLQQLQSQQARLFQGIRSRDLANILYFLVHNDKLDDAFNALPNVAQFALGLQEHEPRNQPQKHAHAKTKQQSRVVIGNLPVLQSLTNKERYYVFYPGYTNQLPTDAKIYMPRAFMSAYRNLPDNIVPYGPETLDINESPYDDESISKLKASGLITMLKPG